MKTILPILFLCLYSFTGFSQDTIQSKPNYQSQIEKLSHELKEIKEEIKYIQILNSNLLKKDSLNKLDIDSLRDDLKNFRVPELAEIENEIGKIHSLYEKERDKTLTKIGWILGLIGALITCAVASVSIVVPLVMDASRRKQVQDVEAKLAQIEIIKTDIKVLKDESTEAKQAAQKSADEAEASNLFVKAYNEKNVGKQIALYSRAIELNPNNSFPYNNRGVIYDNKGEYEKALADYNKVIELNPNDSIGYNNRGLIYGKKGEYDKAFADYNKAIKLNPNDSSLYNSRGITYSKKGEYDKAFADYNKAIELNPNDSGSYNSLADLYYIKGELNVALEYANKAIRYDDTNIIAYLTRCEIYYKIFVQESVPEEKDKFKKLAFEDKLAFDRLLKLESNPIDKDEYEKLAAENEVKYEDLK